MRTTTLGARGPRVGAIGLGCMGMTHAYDLDTPRDDDQSIAVIHQALDAGMNLIDTADVYGPHTNEELVGRALADRRDRAVLATKVGLVWDDPDAAATGTSSPGIGRNGGPSTSGPRSTTVSGGCRPTGSTSTSCTASTPRSRSRRRGARWPRSSRRARRA